MVRTSRPYASWAGISRIRQSISATRRSSVTRSCARIWITCSSDARATIGRNTGEHSSDTALITTRSWASYGFLESLRNCPMNELTHDVVARIVDVYAVSGPIGAQAVSVIAHGGVVIDIRSACALCVVLHPRVEGNNGW